MGVAGSSRVAVAAVTALGNTYLRRIVGLAILVSIFSAANSIILTAPRVYYAMAKDGIFFQRLACVHPRFGTPAFAVMTAVWSAVLALSGTFEQRLVKAEFALGRDPANVRSACAKLALVVQIRMQFRR